MDQFTFLDLPNFYIDEFDRRRHELETFGKDYDFDPEEYTFPLTLSFIGEPSINFFAASLVLGLPFGDENALNTPISAEVIPVHSYRPPEVDVTVIEYYGADGTALMEPKTHDIGTTRDLNSIQALIVAAQAKIHSLEDVHMMTPRTAPEEGGEPLPQSSAPGPPSFNKIHVVYSAFRAPVEISAIIYPPCGSSWWKNAVARGNAQGWPQGLFKPGDSTCIIALDHRASERDKNMTTINGAKILDPAQRQSLVITHDHNNRSRAVQDLCTAQLPESTLFKLAQPTDGRVTPIRNRNDPTRNFDDEGKKFSQQFQHLWKFFGSIYNSQTTLMIERLEICRKKVDERFRHSKAILARLNDFLPVSDALTGLTEEERGPFDHVCSNPFQDVSFNNEFQRVEEMWRMAYRAADASSWFSPITKEAAEYLKRMQSQFNHTALGSPAPIRSPRVASSHNANVVYANELEARDGLNSFERAVEITNQKITDMVEGHLQHIQAVFETRFAESFGGMFTPAVYRLLQFYILAPALDSALTQTREVLNLQMQDFWLKLQNNTMALETPNRRGDSVAQLRDGYHSDRDMHLSLLANYASASAPIQRDQSLGADPERPHGLRGQLSSSQASSSVPVDQSLEEDETMFDEEREALASRGDVNLVIARFRSETVDHALQAASLVRWGLPGMIEGLHGLYPEIINENLIGPVGENVRSSLRTPLRDVPEEVTAAVRHELQRYEEGVDQGQAEGLNHAGNGEAQQEGGGA
ncbi:hypothetical protein SISSUDRAFT_1054845 [Sistotremastrum suecicum HHB10207 ss-3]|uniref:Uncharacterized protein n=1 Tax=Sistotremastrum suecicum HHB10207 ss-3 TaxID=1314776 RepID=A0A165Y6R7_9AGAM|nr:hypothetical protein SISSUDRAFT_1054845 [Sistotremastrum suecicum HHB10207 ss-3]